MRIIVFNIVPSAIVQVMRETNLRLAQEFAKHLDNNDFHAARPFLADDCEYSIGGELHRGADVIVSLYRASYEKGLKELDEIVFESEVELASDQSVLVHYFDAIRKGDRCHHYRCDQMLEFADGKIVRITHHEIPGEKEALLAFRELSK